MINSTVRKIDGSSIVSALHDTNKNNNWAYFSIHSRLLVIQTLFLTILGTSAYAQVIQENFVEKIISNCTFVVPKGNPMAGAGDHSWNGQCINGLAEGYGQIRSVYPKAKSMQEILATRGIPTYVRSIIFMPQSGFLLRLGGGGNAEKISAAQVPPWAAQWAADVISSGDVAQTGSPQAPVPPPTAISPIKPQRNTVTLQLGKGRCGDSCSIEIPPSSPRKLGSDFFYCSAENMQLNPKLEICKELFGNALYIPNLVGRTATIVIESFNNPQRPDDYWIVGGKLLPADVAPKAKVQPAQKASVAQVAPLSTPKGSPTEEAARQSVENQISRNAQGLIKIIGFKKTDGLSKNFGGVQMYEMEWEANLEITGNAWVRYRDFSAGPNTGGLDDLLFASNGFQQIAKGQRINLSGKTIFQKSEAGWRIM